jgi:hypothetical protein
MEFHMNTDVVTKGHNSYGAKILRTSSDFFSCCCLVKIYNLIVLLILDTSLFPKMQCPALMYPQTKTCWIRRRMNM